VGFKIRTKIHLQSKGSMDCTQAIRPPAVGLSGGCQGPGQGRVLKKRCCSPVLLLHFSHTSLLLSPFFKVFQHAPISPTLPSTASDPLSLKVQPAAPVKLSKRARKPSLAVSSPLTSINRIRNIKANLHLLVFGLPFPGLENKINTVQAKSTFSFHF